MVEELDVGGQYKKLLRNRHFDSTKRNLVYMHTAQYTYRKNINKHLAVYRLFRTPTLLRIRRLYRFIYFRWIRVFIVDHILLQFNIFESVEVTALENGMSQPW